MTRMEEFIAEQMISVDNKLPHEKQEVIVWNGEKLVASIFEHRLMASMILKYSESSTSEELMDTGLRPYFGVQKYASEGDRCLSAQWIGVTHWMPAE